MFKVIQKIINTLSVIIIIFSIVVLLIVVTTKQGKAPNIFGYSMFRVVTGSMEPTIQTDSMILIKKTDPKELKVKDIISYYSIDPALDGAVNTHRIVGIDDSSDKLQFITRGDANNINDMYPAREDLVIGRVIFISHFMGVAVHVLSNPLIFIPFIVVPFIIMIIMNLVKTILLTKKIMREEEEAAVKEALEKVLEKRRKEREASGEAEDDAADANKSEEINTEE